MFETSSRLTPLLPPRVCGAGAASSGIPGGGEGAGDGHEGRGEGCSPCEREGHASRTLVPLLSMCPPYPCVARGSCGPEVVPCWIAE
jgi:hypothetical protein